MSIIVKVSEEYREVVAEHFKSRGQEEVQRQIDECLKFLYIVSENGGRFMPLTQEVDEIWHEMIVQTRFYMDLCESLPGNRYIHHRSIGFSDYGEVIGKEKAVSQFLEWVPDYLEKFGEFTEESAKDWAVVQFLQRELGMTLEQINRLER